MGDTEHGTWGSRELGHYIEREKRGKEHQAMSTKTKAQLNDSLFYIAIQSEPALWTVGQYGENDDWHPESDHESKEAAIRRAQFLNGGDVTAALLEAAEAVVEWYEGRVYNGPQERAAMYEKVKAAIAQAKGETA